MDAKEIVRALRWLAKVRTYCDTHMVTCRECEFHGFCTDPDCDESIGMQAEWMAQAADLIDSLTAQLDEYDAIASKYGINGETMLELAKSQIATAKDNVRLQLGLEESQRREQAAVEDLKYYLENNEENGVVYMPKFAVEKLANRRGPQLQDPPQKG